MVFAGWTSNFIQLFWGSWGLFNHFWLIAMGCPPTVLTNRSWTSQPFWPWAEETHVPSQDHGFAGDHPLSKLEPIGTNGEHLWRRWWNMVLSFVSKCWTPGWLMLIIMFSMVQPFYWQHWNISHFRCFEINRLLGYLPKMLNNPHILLHTRN